jgi:hypothetical protein
MMSRAEVLLMRREYLWLCMPRVDEATMAAFCTAHPEHVQADLDFYTEKDMRRATAKAEKKKEGATAEHEKKKIAVVSTSHWEASPSVIYVESSSGLDLDDAF